jgi:hypothetical protein
MKNVIQHYYLKVNPIVDEINADYQWGFRSNGSINVTIFLIPQIMEKNGSTIDSISVMYKVI